MDGMNGLKATISRNAFQVTYNIHFSVCFGASGGRGKEDRNEKINKCLYT